MSNIKSISVSSRHLLSSNGSSRGTAYAMSNKIITRGDQIIACWLDKPGMSTVRALNRETEELSPKVEMGQTAMVDNHCGPALVDTSDDHLHIVIGSHNRPFRYRRTVRSGDINEWTGEKPFPPDATYPSVVVSPSDKLHLTSRAYLPRGETCKLVYQHRLPEDDSWSEAIALVKTPAEDGYVSYTNSLTIDSQGTLHLTFQLFHGDPQVSPFVGYLRSPDDGTTWTHSDGTPVELPGTIDTVEIVDEYTDGHVYCHSVVCDLAGHVFILATAAETDGADVALDRHADQRYGDRPRTFPVQRVPMALNQRWIDQVHVALRPRRTVLVDQFHRPLKQRRSVFAGIINGRRRADEDRVTAVQLADALQSTKHIRHMRPEGTAIDVHFVDDNVTQPRQKRAPPPIVVG